MLFAATIAANLLVLVLAAGGPQTAEAWWFSADQAAAAAAAAPIEAVAKFDLDGVYGQFKFTQKNANESTLCEYDLHGLKGNNKLYHVHIRAVPQYEPERVRNNASAIAELCSDPATGGHLNPHHITAKLPPKSAPLDQYETGDLAGKHGPLVPLTGAGHDDHYVGSFTDAKLPMSGPNSIINRSIVIHKNDGKRWVCATIEALTGPKHRPAVKA